MAESMKVTNTTFAKGSLQNHTLATLTSIKKNTHPEIQTGCFNNSLKNPNGFLISISSRSY